VDGDKHRTPNASRCAFGGGNSKYQAPNSREAPISKLNQGADEVCWELVLEYSLELGCWVLVLTLL
jgi:hypothetical protein